MLIKSPEEMLRFWEGLALKSKILLLKWDLGAGKTLLTKGFAKWLWINENIVQSPTYAYINIYENKILHIDMYRIERYEALVEKWILDQMDQFDYVVVEWPKFIDKLWLEDYLIINIIKKSETEREIIIESL